LSKVSKVREYGKLVWLVPNDIESCITGYTSNMVYVNITKDLIKCGTENNISRRKVNFLFWLVWVNAKRSLITLPFHMEINGQLKSRKLY